MHAHPAFRLATAGALSLAVCLLSPVISGCRSDVNNPRMQETLPGKQALALGGTASLPFHQVNLVANVSSYNPIRTDGNLLNAWGIAVTPTGIFWISANHSGVSVIYDQEGNERRGPVTIPTTGNSPGGAPTGAVFNSTTGFVIPGTSSVSRFIFAGEDGIISAWSPSSGSSAIVAADRSSFDAVYKGLALASDGTHNFLYATDFKGGKVDVFDDQFQPVTTKPFSDPTIPAGFAPFGIENIGGKLYVTYAKQKGPDNEDDEAGPGNGYVDIYSPDGTLITRFASQGALNSPWGLAKAPAEGFRNLSDAILVGNFGDGRINAYSGEGRIIGQLSDASRSPITIQGLWALFFRNVGIQDTTHGDEQGDNDQQGGPGSAVWRLYFTAGPNEENDGIFGYLAGVSTTNPGL